MTSTRHVLVVASRAAAADELRKALLARADRGPAEFTLLLPAPADAEGEAGVLLRGAVEDLRAAGLDIAGQLGEADAIAAVTAVWDASEYDEIVVATLPPGRSHWLALGVPEQIERSTGVPVERVEVQDA